MYLSVLLVEAPSPSVVEVDSVFMVDVGLDFDTEVLSRVKRWERKKARVCTKRGLCVRPIHGE